MNHKALILLFIANAISGIAQGISMIAIPWYFAQKDMLDYFGVCYVLTTLISMFWVPVSGSIIDRFDRKHVFLGATLIGGSIITAITAIGYYQGELSPLLIALVFLFTFLNYNIHFPNVYAFVQEITEPKNYSRITSLMEIIGQMTTISAGAISTLLLVGTENGILKVFGLEFQLGWNIDAWAIYEIFAIDAITYFAAFSVISLIVYKPLTVRKKEKGNTIARLSIGLDYLKQNKPVFWFGILSYMVFMAMLLEAFYLGVSYVSNHLLESGDIYANSKMAYATGAIFTGLTLKYLFTRFSIPFITIILTLGTSAIFLTQALSNSVFLFFTMIFLLGITNAGTRIARVTYLFKNVPSQYFGRAGSIFFLGNIIFRIALLCLFVLPFFQRENNVIYAYGITSLVLFISVLLLIVKYKSFDLSRTA